VEYFAYRSASPYHLVEHSHERFLTTVRANLNLDNPKNLGDPVFSLLGNAAAMQGLGDTTVRAS
jgi:hypothetical protein